MTETRNAHEGAVTYIADDDLVMVVGPNGGLHPISFTNLMKAVRGGIQIGGRNLIQNSAKFTGWVSKNSGMQNDGTYGIFTVKKTEAAWFGVYKIINYEAGNYYTFSFHSTSTNVAGYLKYSSSGNYGVTQTASFSSVIKTVVPIGDGWYRHSFTAKCTNSGAAMTLIEAGNTDEKIRFCAPKLEIGNVPTDWSPAPEDYASSWGGNWFITNYLQFQHRKVGERRYAC